MTGAFVVIANPENRRVSLLQEACRKTAWPEPVVLPWTDVLRDDFRLGAHVSPGTCLRIESPGENFSVERRLIEMGGEAAREERCWPWIPAEEAADLKERHGLVRFQRQWYHGWLEALRRIGRAGGAPMNDTAGIATAFDKAATQALLQSAGVPVPRQMGVCAGFDDLHARMEEARVKRVFLKPCHGSSASGVVALETNGSGKWQVLSFGNK